MPPPEQRIAPIEKEDHELRLAMHNPRDKKAIAEIEQMTGLKVVPFLAPEMSIRRAHLLYRGNILDPLERSAAEAAGPATRTAGGDRSAADPLSRILEYVHAPHQRLDDDIRRMIMERRDGAVIREAAVAAGMKTMFQDGLAKALLGGTTLEEVFRVAR
jgi:hypothetical protein